MNLAFHDAEFASVGFLGLARGIRPPRAPDRAGPLAPLSLSGFSLALSREVFHPTAKAASFASP